MFNVQIVGIANATGAGLGSCGGGIALLVMPVLNALIVKYCNGFLAWRITLFLPGNAMYIVTHNIYLLCPEDAGKLVFQIAIIVRMQM